MLLTSGVLFCEDDKLITKGKSMKSNLDKFFKTNEDSEKNGVWFNISDETGFLLRPFRATNPRIKAAMAAHLKPHARQIEMGTLELSKQTEINIKLFNAVCLAEWRGVEIDGKEVECTPENAMKLFLSLPDLFDALWKHANDFNHYKEDLGN
tara:strand:+ start:78 stop:533 length:456 start_codon:yes stop_codon:yes gene_type:complete